MVSERLTNQQSIIRIDRTCTELTISALAIAVAAAE
jgi:hypothetical protein